MTERVRIDKFGNIIRERTAPVQPSVNESAAGNILEQQNTLNQERIERETESERTRKRKGLFISIVLILLAAFIIFIGIYFYNNSAKSSTTTAAAETTAKQIGLNSNMTKSLTAYFDKLSVLSDKYDKIYSENDRAATDSKEAGDADGYTKYMNNIIISEKEYRDKLVGLNVPTELQDLHRINLERLQIFIDYLPYQINCYFDASTKNIRDSKYEIYIQKKTELYNEYVRIKNILKIEDNFETVFSLKKP